MNGLRAEIGREEIARVVRVLRGIDKDLVNDLKRSMKPEFNTLAQRIASNASAQGAPMSGMTKHNGATKWGGVRGFLSVTPGKNASSLVSLNFEAPKNARGLYISEFAGTAGLRKSKNPNRGAQFVRQLNTVVPTWEKGGRFIYRAFKPLKNGLYLKAQFYVAAWSEKVSQKLENI